MTRFLGDVFESMRTQPGRTGLSLLAISIGIFALTLLVAMLTGLEQRSDRMIRELGLHVVGVTTGNARPDQQAFQRKHVDLLRRNLPGCDVSGVRFDDAPDPDKPGRLKILATDDRLLRVRNWHLARGRFLDGLDTRQSQPNCVLSAANARRGTGQQWNLGGVLPLQQTHFTVVGALQPNASEHHQSELNDKRLVYGDNFLIIPHSLPAYWQHSPRNPAEVDIVFVKGDGNRSPAAMSDDIESLLAAESRLPARQYITSETLVENVRRLQRTIKLTTGSVALLCLLLGGVTMMALMIANVKERIPEIGLRRALGASRASIYALFVTEGILLTTLAGALGILAALITVNRIAEGVQLPVALTWGSLLVPAVTALILGILFTFFPARLAANISPSEALRAE